MWISAYNICFSNMKLYTFCVNLTAEYAHINKDWLFSSIRIHFPSFKSTECINLIEKQYRSTKSYMSD